MSSTHDHDRTELLIPAGAYLNRMADTARDTLAVEMLAAFDQWKESKTDKDGNVVIFRNLGLWSIGQEPTTKIPAANAEPWETADQWTRNNIDLAFFLWTNNFPPFAQLTMSYGLPEVFSAVGAMEWQTPHVAISSFIRLNGFLCRSMLADLDSKREVPMTKAEAVRNRVEGKQSKDRQRKALWIALATEYTARHTDCTHSDVVEHVWQIVKSKHGSDYLRAPATIGRAINKARLFRPR